MSDIITEKVAITAEHIKQLAKLQGQIKRYTEQADDLKELIRANLTPGTVYETEGYELTLTDPRVFSVELFREKYDPEKFSNLYESKPRAAAAIRSFLSKSEFEALQVPGTPSVRLKKVEVEK